MTGTDVTAREIDGLADALFAALEAGSVEGVLACYAPGARIWHNFDQLTMTPQESIAGVELLFSNFSERCYAEVRRQLLPGGFVQQHILRMRRPDGSRVDWPGCIVCDVAGGKITRLDEYVDLASLGAQEA